MPRGSGKTTLAESAALWAALYGYRRFVGLIGATDPLAGAMLESIKIELETNELIAEDFGEIVWPIRCLEGITIRANGQLLRGQRTKMEWTDKEIVLASIPGNPAATAIIYVVGITGAIRGKKRGGRRPDFIVLDDPQTDESARSPTQIDAREAVITRAVLGLAGPGKKISVVMPCTVIYPEDLADRYLDRSRHPEWNGVRTKLVYSMPENEKLWEEYAAIRKESMRLGNRGAEATAFYVEHKEEMDRGAHIAWEQRFNHDEKSAIQNAMNLKIDNPRAFFSEYQNDPQADLDSGSMIQLTTEAVALKLNRVPRGTVPRDCGRLTAFIDVHANILYWTVCAWNEKFGGAVIDYGTFPKQPRDYFSQQDPRPGLADLFPGIPVEAQIYAGLAKIVPTLLRNDFVQAETGATLRVDRMLLDSGYKTDTIYQFIRESPEASLIYPSKGFGLGAGKVPVDEWPEKPGERRGPHWRLSAGVAGRGRMVKIDVNLWKSFVAERLLAAPGAPGSLYLFGSEPSIHALFSDHLTSEKRIQTEGRGRVVEEWQVKPENPENHWFDCLVGCAVAASVTGLRWSASGNNAATPTRKKLNIKEMYEKARSATGGG